MESNRYSLPLQGGTLDLAGAARIVLRDWSIGKIPRFTPAPATPEATQATPSLAELYGKDEEVLSKLKTRKDMRRSTGLVKLIAGHVESRQADAEAGWAGVERDGDGRFGEEQEETDDGDDEQAGSAEEDEDVDFDEPDVDESEEDDEPAPAPAGKRKRPEKSTGPPTHPNKKVSFAPDPKESKRARAAGSVKKVTSPALKPRPVSSKLKTSAANIKVSKVSQKSSSPRKGGEEAYDFRKFF
jgi:nuclear GTP-binding protein